MVDSGFQNALILGEILNQFTCFSESFYFGYKDISKMGLCSEKKCKHYDRLCIMDDIERKKVEQAKTNKNKRC